MDYLLEEIEQDPSRLKPQKRRKTFLALDREEEEGDSSHLDTVKDLKMYANSLVMSRKRLKQQVLPVYVPVYNEEGKLVNPGTGYLFQLYDRIYVRNPHYNPDYRASKSRSHIARYYRGIIVDIDTIDGSMYKVLYWEDDPHDVDAMSPSEWPAADDSRLFRLGILYEYTDNRRRTIDMRCRCESPSCAGFAHMKCQRKFSTECCLKSPYDCAFHKQDDRHQEEEDSPIPGDNSALFTFSVHVPASSVKSCRDVWTIRFSYQIGHLYCRGRFFAKINPLEGRDGLVFRIPQIQLLLRQKSDIHSGRDGVLVEISSASELEGQPRRGAPPVTRKRRLPATDEAAALQSPSTRTGREWPAIPTSTGRTDSVATTSDDGGHVQFVSPDPESMHSPTPSPTPSACYEVEISPDDTHQRRSPSHLKEALGTPRLQDQDRGQSANGISGDIPEMSLRPRVVPSRDHPYERTTKTSRPSQPNNDYIGGGLNGKEARKAGRSSRTTVLTRPEQSQDRMKELQHQLQMDRNLPIDWQRFRDPHRTSHPFDAELMAVGFFDSLFWFEGDSSRK
ncbi:hypothetical protein OSTOST_22859 [Ostertagia ostertagi]